MPRTLLATLLLTLALPLAAADVREITWSDLIPPDAPPQVVDPTPIHDLSQLADALAEVDDESLRDEINERLDAWLTERPQG